MTIHIEKVCIQQQMSMRNWKNIMCPRGVKISNSNHKISNIVSNKTQKFCLSVNKIINHHIQREDWTHKWE